MEKLERVTYTNTGQKYYVNQVACFYAVFYAKPRFRFYFS